MTAGSARTYLVEHGLPGLTEAELALLQSALSEACTRLTARGQPVRYLGSAFLPRPHRFISLFEALDPEAVRRVSISALVPVTLLEAAITLPAPPG